MRDTALASDKRVEATLATGDSRFVVVHYHIFKNGGSTIQSILEREFPLGFATLHGAHASETLDAKHLASFLRRHPKVAAVSSHHLRYPKPAIRHIVVFDCCFLRHPLDRLNSVYRYLQNETVADPYAARARRMPAHAFFRHLIDESPHMVSNVQVTQVACSGEFIRPAHETDLEYATTRFRDAALPGVVEMFDESLVAAEYFLKPAFPKLTMEYVPQNVTRAAARHENLARRWGPDVYEDLLRLNQLDLELFQRAGAEIQRRFCLVPASARKLEEFRRRCAQLRAGGEFAGHPGPILVGDSS